MRWKPASKLKLLTAETDQCGWCQNQFDLIDLLAIENTIEHLCPGCYYCWQHGIPRLARDER